MIKHHWVLYFAPELTSREFLNRPLKKLLFDFAMLHFSGYLLVLQVLQEWGQSFFTRSDVHCPVHAHIMQSVLVSMQVSVEIQSITLIVNCKRYAMLLYFQNEELQISSELLEARLAPTIVNYHRKIKVSILLNQRLALTMLRAPGPRQIC